MIHKTLFKAIILTIIIGYFASGGLTDAAETRVRTTQLNALRPRPQSTANNTIYIEPGIVSVANNAKIEYAGGNSPTFAVVTADSRIDIVTINSSGTIEVTQGTQAASPTPPTYPSDKLVIAEVTVDETVTVVVNDADIKDVRPFLNLGGGVTSGTEGAYVNIDGDTMTGTLNLPANGLVAGTNQLVLSGGNVGIGTTNPGYKLDIDGDIRAVGTHKLIFNTNGELGYSTVDYGNGLTSGIVLSGASTEHVTLNTPGASPIVFRTNNLQRAIIAGDGNVGIGTTAPGEKLHVYGNTFFNPPRSTGDLFEITMQGDSSPSMKVHSPSGKWAASGDDVWYEFPDANHSFRAEWGGPWIVHTSDPLIFETVDSNDYIAFEPQNSEAMRITTAGNVGIGTTVPAALLQVGGGTGNDGEIRVTSDAGRTGVFAAHDATHFIHIGAKTNHSLQLITNDSRRVAIGSEGGVTIGNTWSASIGAGASNLIVEGNVGIGTTNPTKPLHVHGDIKLGDGGAAGNAIFGTGDTRNVKIYASDTAYKGGYLIAAGASHPTDPGAVLLTHGDYTAAAPASWIKFRYANNGVITDQMTLTSTGNVGIGTTSPADILEVANPSGPAQVRVTSDATRDSGLGFYEATTQRASIFYDASDDKLRFSTRQPEDIEFSTDRSGTETVVMTLKDSGNVGIGTTVPMDKLDVQSNTIQVADNTINFADVTDGYVLTFDTGTNTWAGEAAGGGSSLWSSGAGGIYYNSGNVGIGTTAPLFKLHLDGPDDNTNYVTISENGNARVYFGDSTTGGVIDLFDDSNASTAKIRSYAVDGVQAFFNAGNVGIGTTGPVEKLHIHASSGDIKSAIVAGGEANDAILFFGTPYGGNPSNGLKAAIIAEGVTSYSRSKLHFCLDNTATNSRSYDAAISNARMTILQNGNVGIGTTVPGAKLHVYGGDVRADETIYYDAEFDNGNSGTADTIDWGVGNKQKSTLTGNCTFTFTAPPGPCNLILKLVQDGTGSRTVTWPTTIVKWPGGTAPTLSTAINAVDIVSFYYDGTNYYGQAGLDFK